MVNFIVKFFFVHKNLHVSFALREHLQLAKQITQENSGNRFRNKFS